MTFPELPLPKLTPKRTLATGLGLGLALLATSASALVVFDPTNYAQAVKQVQAWTQQYNQMREGLQTAQATLDKAKAQIDAVTGIRGLGDLFNDPALRNMLPADFASALDSLNATGLLNGRALSLRNSSALYDCDDLSEEVAKKSCRALLGQNVQAQVFHEDTLSLLNARSTQIDSLRGQINQTEDPKAIAELQARLAAEQAQVSNDQNKLLIAQAMLEVNRRRAIQAEAERVNALTATNKPDILANFDFGAVGTPRVYSGDE